MAIARPTKTPISCLVTKSGSLLVALRTTRIPDHILRRSYRPSDENCLVSKVVVKNILVKPPCWTWNGWVCPPEVQSSLQIVPSEQLPASMVRRTASFSIFMYLEMTWIMSFLSYAIISGEQPALSERSRKVSRSFAVSLEQRNFNCHHPLCPSLYPGQFCQDAGGLSGRFHRYILP